MGPARSETECELFGEGDDGLNFKEFSPQDKGDLMLVRAHFKGFVEN